MISQNGRIGGPDSGGKDYSQLSLDVTVFDPATINTLEPEYVQDLPGNETRMIQNASGIHYTLVNGRIAVDHGKATGACSGAILRPTVRPN